MTEVVSHASAFAQEYQKKFTQLVQNRLERIAELPIEYLGSPLNDFIKKLPSFIRGGIAQGIACHSKPIKFSHSGNPAVMFVPGVFCRPSVFNKLAVQLEKLGADVYYPRPFLYYHGSLANTREHNSKVISETSSHRTGEQAFCLFRIGNDVSDLDWAFCI